MAARQSKLNVVIGAGPYGLSAAAHLARRGLRVAIFGRPMESWQQMPKGMLLKSSWSASSLSDPDQAYGLDHYAGENGAAPLAPIPLSFFLDYCDWFRARAVPVVDSTQVSAVCGDADGGFEVRLADGRSLHAARVVVATGIDRFAHLPSFARGLPTEMVSHTSRHRDFGVLAGARVAVVGAGQSALESAALLHEAGASVEVIARREIVWVDRRLHDLHPLIRTLLYAPSDVGPAGVSRLVHLPLFIRRLPGRARHAMTARSVRPSGATWLRERVEDVVCLTTNTRVVGAVALGQALTLRLSDGSIRRVDHMLLGTGYRPDVRRLDFLSPDLLSRVATAGPLPRLNRWFESSVPGLHFVGALALHDFGPLCRFVAGARVASRQVTRRALAA